MSMSNVAAAAEVFKSMHKTCRTVSPSEYSVQRRLPFHDSYEQESKARMQRSRISRTAKRFQGSVPACMNPKLLFLSTEEVSLSTRADALEDLLTRRSVQEAINTCIE